MNHWITLPDTGLRINHSELPEGTTIILNPVRSYLRLIPDWQVQRVITPATVWMVVIDHPVLPHPHTIHAVTQTDLNNELAELASYIYQSEESNYFTRLTEQGLVMTRKGYRR